MGLNKGEWSELYTLFYLLINGKIKIVDSRLNVINEEIFEVKEILSKKKLGLFSFKRCGIKVFPNIFGESIEPIHIEELKQINEMLFNEIKKGKVGSGSFSIPKIQKWLDTKGILNTYKANSKIKEDLILINLDTIREENITLGYSIKSQLGHPATLLNASNHTKFKYEVIGLDPSKIKEINNIFTTTKLKDRISKIKQLGGKIKFHSLESHIFNKNLEMIDMLLPKALAEVLLNSYTENIKDLKKLFAKNTIYNDINLANKKLTDFLLAVSLGMFPSIKWDGNYTANGGLIVVSYDSNIYVLDMIYYSNQLKEYLINETKLDSPSSTRYDMLNLKIKDNRIYFTLNLQIRYK